MYSGVSAPTGWLFCDGSAISRATYSALYSIIGTAFGVGDGSTTFNLPNMQDVFPIGASASKARASIGGDTDHIHSGPYHNHHVGTINVEHSGAGGGDSEYTGAGHWVTIDFSTGYDGNEATSSASSLPSYLALNYIIKI